MVRRSILAVTALSAIASTPAVASERAEYVYDLRGRIVSAVYTLEGDDYETTYAYDNADNRTNMTVVNADYGNQPNIVTPEDPPAESEALIEQDDQAPAATTDASPN